MLTVKVIGYFDKEERQLISLLSAEEVTYEFITSKAAEDEDRSLCNIMGGSFHVVGAINMDKSYPRQIAAMTLKKGTDLTTILIENAFVFIMDNGKTVEKFEVK